MDLENFGFFQQIETQLHLLPKNKQEEGRALCELLFCSLKQHLTIMSLVGIKMDQISKECGLDEGFRWLKIDELKESAQELERQMITLGRSDVFARTRWEMEKLSEKNREIGINLLLEIMLFWAAFSSTIKELLCKLSDFRDLPNVSRLISFMEGKITIGGEEDG